MFEDDKISSLSDAIAEYLVRLDRRQEDMNGRANAGAQVPFSHRNDEGEIDRPEDVHAWIEQHRFRHARKLVAGTI